MTIRTRETTITFRHPFSLTAVDGSQPAGAYRLITDEEEIIGLSFLAFRRTATMLHIPAVSRSLSGRNQVFLVDPAELAAALELDGRTSRNDPSDSDAQIRQEANVERGGQA